MQRLTEKTKDCFGYRLKDGSDSEVGFFKNYDAFYSHMMMVRELGEYEDLEEQGLLLRLPVKIGDTVYTSIHSSGWYFREKDKPYEAEIVFIGINASEPFMNIEYKKGYMLSFKLSEIGERIFLTKEEAEAKLREMEE